MSAITQSPTKTGSGADVAAPSPTFISRVVRRSKKLNLLLVPIVLFAIVIGMQSEQFFTVANQLTIMRAASTYVIVGVGQALVMTSRNIDLSVGSMLGLIMGLVGTFLFNGGNVALAMVLAIGLGAAFGLFNGAVVTYLRVPALLATLGTLVAFRGLVNQFMYGTTVSRFPAPIVWMGQGKVTSLGIPVPVLFAIITVIIGAILYHYTRLGRYAVAIGGNEEAAILSGINVRRWKMALYAFQGMCVGLASLIWLGRLDAAHPGFGTAMELHVIAGVVLGGTILFGGFATMWGVVLGMLLIEILGNGLLLAGLGFYWQHVFLGFMLIIAVALQMARYRKQSVLV